MVDLPNLPNVLFRAGIVAAMQGWYA